MRRILIVLLLVSALGITGARIAGRDVEPSVPTPLTEPEKLRIVNAAQAVEIAELRLAGARTELTRLLQAAAREGYDLTQSLDYVPKPKAP